MAELPKADSASHLPFSQDEEISRETLEESVSVAGQKCLSSDISVLTAGSLACVMPGHSAPWHEFIGASITWGAENVGCSSDGNE